MLDANARPTFDDLDQEFTKMARDPGRYLVIDGDQLKRVPNSLKITSGTATNSIFSDINTGDDEYPDKELVGKSLRPVLQIGMNQIALSS